MIEKKYAYLFETKGISCDICYTKISYAARMLTHKKSFHNSSFENKCPYGSILKDTCPAGCSFQSTNKDDLKIHLVLYHSESKLKLWGINRNLLKEKLNLCIKK